MASLDKELFRVYFTDKIELGIQPTGFAEISRDNFISNFVYTIAYHIFGTP